MNDMPNQAKLSSAQIEAFYHDDFLTDQVADFQELVGNTGSEVVVDIGGGCGYFAHRLSKVAGYPARVVDMDPTSIESCRKIGVEGTIGDALTPPTRGDERVICFNLILHHLVGANERETRALQMRALQAWVGKGVRVFVNEYIYQSVVGQLSPRLIYEITSSKLLSAIARPVSALVPALRANTFGVGVRFRSHEDWLTLFAEAGFCVVDKRLGEEEEISLPRRALLIATIRRDSFLLASEQTQL